MLRSVYLFALISIVSINLSAQTIDNYVASQNPIPFQKLYLHIDREFYFIGDTLWFAAYQLDAQTHLPIKDSCNLYVELIDSDGKFIQKELFPLANGFCPGYLSLDSDTILEGNYLVRAYTDYLKPFGEEYFFTKRIKLSEVKSSFKQEIITAETSKKTHIELFPEGGFLLTGKMNQMAFIATDTQGKEVKIGGNIINSKGENIAEFRSGYKGKGRFFFKPVEGETYSLSVNEEKNIEYEFPEIRTKGTKLMVSRQNENGITLNILSNTTSPNSEFHVAILHRGEGLNCISIKNEQITNGIKVQVKYLRNGINRLVLLNEQYEPLSERLVFIDGENIKLRLSTNADEYSTRDLIEVKFRSPLGYKKSEFKKFSMAVVNENALNSSGTSQNIYSFLLADSELKGQINSPADYFIDDENTSSKEKLNLLMLTQGWSNYVWNSILEYKKPPFLANRFGAGISGIIRKEYTNKPLVNAQIMLSVIKDEVRHIEFAQSGVSGDFEFNNLSFFDSALVVIQGKNQKNKTKTSLHLTNSRFLSPEVTSFSHTNLAGFIDIPVSIFRSNYLNELKLNEYYPERNSRLLADIDIVAKKKKDMEERRREQMNPLRTLIIETQHTAYSNVFEFLKGRVAGAQVIHTNNGYAVKIRGGSTLSGSSFAVCLIDGFEVPSISLEELPMFEIKRVEVLKGIDAAILGMYGARGAVSVTTKSAEDDYYEAPDYIRGTLVHKIKGFAPYREFYSPKYTAENINSEAPDFRTTLYWNPLVEMTNGSSEVTFYSDDNIARYKVFVEGITETGKIVMGEASFEVNKRQ